MAGLVQVCKCICVRVLGVDVCQTVIFSDYVSCILGLVRQGSNWSLNPFGVGSSFNFTGSILNRVFV